MKKVLIITKMLYICIINKANNNLKIKKMKLQDKIQEVRNESTKILKESNGRIAVITETPYTKTKSTYGVQFWTKEMIETGVSKNADNTVSKFIEIL